MVAPVRVLYLRDTTFVCGPGKTILNTFRTADRSKVSIALGIPGWTSAPNPLITAAQSIGLPIVPLPDGGRVGVMGARRLARVIEDGEFVMIHSRYVGWDDKTMIVVDIFKVVNGRFVEHWDVVQEEVAAEKTISGNSMFPIK